jgi:hypothetical protein
LIASAQVVPRWTAKDRRNHSGLEKNIPAVIDASSRPIMECRVPRMKLGAFYGMANNILDTANKENWRPLWANGL